MVAKNPHTNNINQQKVSADSKMSAVSNNLCSRVRSLATALGVVATLAGGMGFGFHNQNINLNINLKTSQIIIQIGFSARR